MLLHVDGLNERWNNGVASPYVGKMGWHETGDVERYVPTIFQRVRKGIPGHLRTLDMTKEYPLAKYYETANKYEDQTNDDTFREVKLMTLNSMRRKLVKHFHYR